MIFDTWEASSFLNPAGDPGVTVGITSGCFDLLHYYHLTYLERCAAKCEFLVVGIDADDLVSLSKDRRPIIPQDHRAAMVASLDMVDAVFIMWSKDDLLEVAQYAEFMFKNDTQIYGEAVICPPSTELIVIPDVLEAYSSSDLKDMIKATWKGGEKS